MILLYEDIAYSREVLRNLLGDDYYRWTRKASDSEMACLNSIGYFYSRNMKDLIFLLPKVFVDADNIKFVDSRFNGGLNAKGQKVKEEQLKGWKQDILNRLPLYVYLAIRKYYIKYNNSTIGEERSVMDIAGLSGRTNNTLLELILSLLDFYREHRSLVILIYKSTHSGYNKVNWNRTIRSLQPIIAKGKVLYPLVINHRKLIDYNEKLMVLFFSTLRYINDRLGLPVKIDCPYRLMSRTEFLAMVDKGSVLKMLRRIKHNYFRDDLVLLWRRLYAFYTLLDQMRAGKIHNDFLLVRNFNIVFEDMIDELIGEDLPRKLMSLKEQKDGKIIDHLFKHQSVTIEEDKGNQIYYIGDSKYYKNGATPVGSSLYKQYTYAKNIIQFEMNLFNSRDSIHLNYMDTKTEGFNISPNFFITGDVENCNGFKDCYLELDKGVRFKYSYIFRNRLFDRDTLFLQQYNINFLFVLYTYVSGNASIRSSFSKDAKNKFRKNFIDSLNDVYSFYLLEAKSNEELAISRHFRRLVGKIYCPFRNCRYIILALKKVNNDPFNDDVKVEEEDLESEKYSILNECSDDFYIYPYTLGTNMDEHKMAINK